MLKPSTVISIFRKRATGCGLSGCGLFVLCFIKVKHWYNNMISIARGPLPEAKISKMQLPKA
ncbi:MAG: hypothetical protein EAZ51_00315 [Sphingobacteriales bacterium]|nr:MAG: hypothetical protein EAZ64_07255 [Sphingobacteriales bacterium]TAF83881.1 MAG: hypothetical protein EAZ51_00315 [Sphingobacteriales bacterium]